MRSTSAEPRPLARSQSRLEALAARTPLFVVGYFATQLAVRLCLSANLEVDDAEMVGQIHWAWGYANSHPPLFHWIVRLSYEAFGYWPAATAVPRYLLLSAAYLLVFDAARRCASSPIAGALAVAALFFIPVVAWKTQGKLTHSVLGFAATAGLLHATVLVLVHGRRRDFVWLGVAAAAGILAKYNFLLVLAALGVAIVLTPWVRERFARRGTLWAFSLTLVLIAPHLLWLRENAALARERSYMLRTGGGPLGINLSAESVADGLVSLALVVLVSVGPGLAAFGAARFASTRQADRPLRLPSRQHSTIVRFIGTMMIVELLAFVVIVTAAGFTQVHERYLLVLLPPVALWLGLSVSNARAAAICLGAALVVAVVITIARPASVMFGRSRLAYPYDQVAAAVAPSNGTSVATVGDRPENAANLAIRLPGAQIYTGDRSVTSVLVIADDEQRLRQTAERLPAHFQADGDVRVLELPLRWRPQVKVKLALQVYRRRADAILNRTGGAASLEDVIVNRIDAAQRGARHFRVRHTDAEGLLHAHDELERVDRIEAEPTRAEERHVVGNLIRRRLEHEVFHQHLFDLLTQIRLRHTASAEVVASAS